MAIPPEDVPPPDVRARPGRIVAGSLLLSGALVGEALALFLLCIHVSADVQASCGAVLDAEKASVARGMLSMLLALGIAPWMVAAGLTRKVRWFGAGVLATSPAWLGVLAPENYFGPWFCL